MRLFASRLKIVVEPTGCLGLAGLLGPDAQAVRELRGQRIGVVISGGNVDLERFAALVGATAPVRPIRPKGGQSAVHLSP